MFRSYRRLASGPLASANTTANTTTLTRVIILVMLSFGLAACQDSKMNDLREFVATAYQDKKPDIEPLPEIAPYKEFAYSASEQQNPFSFKNIITSRQEGDVSSGNNPDSNRRKEPLERYPLDALKMVGTMSQDSKPWVVVQTSEGTAHRATIGNYMGQNDGQIKQIVADEQRIVLAEVVLDASGRWVTREVEIKIDE